MVRARDLAHGDQGLTSGGDTRALGIERQPFFRLLALQQRRDHPQLDFSGGPVHVHSPGQRKLAHDLRHTLGQITRSGPVRRQGGPTIGRRLQEFVVRLGNGLTALPPKTGNVHEIRVFGKKRGDGLPAMAIPRARKSSREFIRLCDWVRRDGHDRPKFRSSRSFPATVRRSGPSVPAPLPRR